MISDSRTTATATVIDQMAAPAVWTGRNNARRNIRLDTSQTHRHAPAALSIEHDA